MRFCRVVLGPFELEETVAAHEFSHIRQRPTRGFRSWAPATESPQIIPDAGDLMAMPEQGCYRAY